MNNCCEVHALEESLMGAAAGVGTQLYILLKKCLSEIF